MRLLILTLGLAAYAQQTSPATYDTSRKIKLQGAVTRIEWTYPHAYVFIDVKDASGKVVNWAVDLGDLESLDSWTPGAVPIGSVVNVEGFPAREGKRVLRQSITASNGRILFQGLGGIPGGIPNGIPSGTEPPRWPDGHVRLGPEPGKRGYWGHASASALTENSHTRVAMSKDGLLTNLADTDKVAPFLPWAKSVYEYRQRSLLKDDPALRCLPIGGPRQFQTENGFQFIEQPELGRILVLLGGGDRNWRVIYTDGRPLAQGEDLVLTYYGTSVGHWENKDTLVVDSVGFNERFWMAAGGLPHTEALKLTERFSRPDYYTLKYEVTVNDPRTYSRPWSGGWTLQWIADQDPTEYFCEDNAESTFVR